MTLKSELAKVRAEVRHMRNERDERPVPATAAEIFFGLEYDEARARARDKLEWQFERAATNEEAAAEVVRVLAALGYSWQPGRFVGRPPGFPPDFDCARDAEPLFDRVKAHLEAEIVAVLAARGVERESPRQTWLALQAARNYDPAAADPHHTVTPD